MRLLLLTALLVTLAAPLAAQAEGGAGLALGGAWKAARGDSLVWASPAYDARGWTDVSVPGEWETAFPDHDGFGWYRREVYLPEEMADGPLGVQFGTVGDAFEVYWNGVRVGGRGTFPPRFVEGVAPALLLVPAEALKVRPRGPHVLAVRVYNAYAYGGLLGEVRVGRYDALAQKRSPRDIVVGGLVSFFLAIGVYHLAFWVRRRAARENLYFALLSLCVSVYGSTYSGAVAGVVMPYINPYRLGLIALLCAVPVFVALVCGLFELRMRPRERTAVALCAVAVVVTVSVPLDVLAEFNKWIDFGLGVALLLVVIRAGAAASPHRPHARTLVVGTMAFASTLGYDLLSEYGFVPVARVLPGVPSLFWLGFLVFVVAVGFATAGKWALTEVTALVDPLTELARRHVLEDALRRETDRLRRAGGSLALVMIDLDFFKQINDAYGHRTGDQVLARVGRLLRHSARNVDLPARFGGEEFAVLLYGSRLDGALSFAERFRANLREMRVSTPRGDVQVTASLGVAVGTDLVSPQELVDAADQALYRAKTEGRDRLVAVELTGAPASAPERRRQA